MKSIVYRDHRYRYCLAEISGVKNTSVEDGIHVVSYRAIQRPSRKNQTTLAGHPIPFYSEANWFGPSNYLKFNVGGVEYSPSTGVFFGVDVLRMALGVTTGDFLVGLVDFLVGTSFGNTNSVRKETS